MAKKLYVGNLSYGTSEGELRDLFAEFGEVVSATIITDRDTGRSKGFGFVEMDTDEAAQNAISKLNGMEVDGRKLTVSEARPRERDSGGSRGGYSGGGGGYGGGRDRGGRPKGRGGSRGDRWGD
ncbi:MAG: hypothetical protein Kow00124_04290 [Anaerolineae bacterium]